MKSIPRIAVAVICLIVSAVCATMIIQKIIGRTRLDLTQYRVYTLTQGTRNILGEINQPLTLTLYYSRVAAMKGPEQIRYWNNYYLYVHGLLEEYVHLAKGQVRLEVIDPRPFSDDEEAAKTRGVQRFEIGPDEGFFFGLVARTELGKEKVIPFFEPARQEFVEYDVSKLLNDVIHTDKKKLGILSPLQVMGMADMSPYLMQMMQMQGRTPPPPWVLVQRLRDEYDVVSVPADTEAVAPDIDFLMVIHPKNLAEKTLFAIDQYVMKGGKLAVFVDPFCMADQPQQEMRGMGGDQSSNLNAILEKWGVTMDPGAIAGDRALAGRMPEGKLITLLNLTEECANADEVVSAKLHTVRMFNAGALRRVGGKATVTPLFTTTATGNVWTPQSPFELQNPDPSAIARDFQDGAEPVILACRITGKLESNFPDGIMIEDKKPEDASDTPPASQPTTRKVTGLKETAAENTVLVFADVDMLADYLAYERTFFGMAKTGDNESVALNAVEFLAGSNDLIGIRSRGRFQRPFDRVDRIEAEADKASAGEIAALESQVKQAQERLSKLNATGENQKLVASAVLAERQKIQDEIYRSQKSIRQIKDRRRVKIEKLKARLQAYNLSLAPAAVLIIAIGLWIVQRLAARGYAARRNAQ